MQTELKQSLAAAIAAFNSNRRTILEDAFKSDDPNLLTQLEEEYDTMRSAYMEILRRQLDQNHHLYESLITSAITQTEKLHKSIRQLNNVNSILQLITQTINTLGRVLITLGI